MVSFLEVLSFFLLFLVCSSTSLLGTPPKSCRTKKLPQNFEETCKAQNWECFVVEARISRSPPVTHNCSDLSKMIGICCNTDLRTKCCERHPLGSGLRGAPRCPRTHLRHQNRSTMVNPRGHGQRSHHDLESSRASAPRVAKLRAMIDPQ